jgi:hypothetical protein
MDIYDAAKIRYVNNSLSRQAFGPVCALGFKIPTCLKVWTASTPSRGALAERSEWTSYLV